MKKITLLLSALLFTVMSFAAALGEGYAKVTDITTLVAGDKVVLYCDDANLGITGWDGNKTATAATTGWVEYVVEAADGGVLLKDGDKYVDLTAKNSFHYTATGGVCKVTADGILYITLASDGKDYLLYENANNGSPLYRMYINKAGTNNEAQYKPFYVYEVTGEGGSTTPDTPTEPETPDTPETPEGGVVTFDADVDKGNAGASAAAYEISKNGVTVNVTSGLIGTYNNENHYRIYKNQTLTVTSTVGNIVSVEFTCTASDEAQYGPGCFVADKPSYAYSGFVGTWTGAATEVVFTASSNQVRATQIVVTIGEVADDFVTAPAIKGETNFREKTTVTIEAQEGLEVYYTLDGTEPTKAATKYSAPFELDVTATVKAVAYDGDKASEVVEKKFNKMQVLTCAEAVDLCETQVSTEKYIIRGYVTKIAQAWDDNYKNISFWMADTKDGGEVLEAFRAKPSAEGEENVKVGDYVEIVGNLILYVKDETQTPEVNTGGIYTIIPAPTTGLENVTTTETVSKVIKNGQIYIIKGGKIYNALGAEVK